MPNKRPPRKQWLFSPTITDEQIVEQERQRLTTWTGRGVTITRADAIRSLFARAQVLDSIAELEAELESRKESVLLAEITSRKAKEMQEVA